MSGEHSGTLGNDTIFLGRSLVAGIWGGMLLLLLAGAWSAVWDPLTTYTWHLSGTMGIQWWILLLLLLFLTGALSAGWNASAIEKGADAAVAGLVSGAGAAVVFLLLPLCIPAFTPMNLSYWGSPHLAFGQNLALMLIVVLLFMGLSAPGALLHVYAETKRAQNSGERNRVPPVVLLLIVLLCAAALLPPAVAVAGVKSGLIERIPAAVYVPPVAVERSGDESVVITTLGDAGPDLGWLAENYYPFVILVDGRDVSSGSELTVDPPEGLGYAAGSAVVLTGSALPPGGGPVRIEIINSVNERLPCRVYDSRI